MQYNDVDSHGIMIITVAISAQGTSWAAAVTQASFHRSAARDESHSNMCTSYFTPSTMAPIPQVGAASPTIQMYSDPN